MILHRTLLCDTTEHECIRGRGYSGSCTVGKSAMYRKTSYNNAIVILPVSPSCGTSR